MIWSLGSGSAYTGSAGAWSGANYIATSESTSVVATLNATWQITGVQLEEGTYATPFEKRNFGLELQMCQRYYEKSFDLDVKPDHSLGLIGGTHVFSQPLGGGAFYYLPHPINFVVNKRAAPVVVSIYNSVNSSGTIRNESVNQDWGTLTIGAGQHGLYIGGFTSPGSTPSNTSAFSWTVDSEL
jgi:hypothetical protein